MSPPLAGWGISVDLPAQWEGRLYVRTEATDSYADPASRAASGPQPAGSHGWGGETTSPVLHLGNFALPAVRGDFGSGALELMGINHAFICLIDFGDELAGTALFASEGIPKVTPQEFSAATLQQHIPGQLGYQRFFTVSGRPMCLFAVVGGSPRLGALCHQINTTLSKIEVSP